MKHNIKKLKFWQKARSFSKDIYLVTKSFPKEEVFGLTNQMRRSSISIVSNIAQGSSAELEAQVLLALDMGFINNEKLNELSYKINEVQKMIRVFQNRVLKQ